MLSVRGIYENGKIKLLEPILSSKRAKVIVTILEELDETEDQNREVDVNIFDELVGAVSVRDDGSIKHDRYIVSRVR
jgi:predicted DNA-binding antitoxin AbrB/MazE fold protein